MSERPAFERILALLYDAMLDDTHWPATSALIDEACGIAGNALLVGEGPKDDSSVACRRTTQPSGAGSSATVPNWRKAAPSSHVHPSGNRRAETRCRSRGNSRARMPMAPLVTGTLPGRSTAAHRDCSCSRHVRKIMDCPARGRGR